MYSNLPWTRMIECVCLLSFGNETIIFIWIETARHSYSKKKQVSQESGYDSDLLLVARLRFKNRFSLGKVTDLSLFLYQGLCKYISTTTVYWFHVLRQDLRARKWTVCCVTTQFFVLFERRKKGQERKPSIASTHRNVLTTAAAEEENSTNSHTIEKLLSTSGREYLLEFLKIYHTNEFTWYSLANHGPSQCHDPWKTNWDRNWFFQSLGW